MMEITWFGQSMFSLEGGGITVVVDPVSPETGYDAGVVEADVVLLTHEHFDHSYTKAVSGSRKIIKNPGKQEFEGTSFTGIKTFHDPSGGKLRGPNIVYTWKQAGLSIAHLGDLGEMVVEKLKESIKGVDIMMIPVGGVFTIDGKQASTLLRELSPRVAIPMHYKTPACNIGLEKIDGFLNSFSGTSREIKERSVSVSRENLPESTEVWVLSYR
ncbi:MAG: MBL fold metallo-hydrolase [Actinomycetota bacterium]|nr:MBL fold metallo-hydrolase [Actinomycetota bacterium]